LRTILKVDTRPFVADGSAISSWESEVKGMMAAMELYGDDVDVARSTGLLQGALGVTDSAEVLRICEDFEMEVPSLHIFRLINSRAQGCCTT